MPNVEDLIKKAMEEGKFDNLPGKGKKIHLEGGNPNADPDWELAYGILKDAGYSLPWIETLREIEKDIEAARVSLRRAWEYYKDSYGIPDSDDAAVWERARQVFKTRLDDLNKRIRDYNLHVPSAHFQRPALNYDQEVQKVSHSSK